MIKLFVLLCVVVVPATLFCQKRTYTISFKNLKATNEFENRKFEDANISDPGKDQPMISITDVPKDEVENIKLTHASDKNSVIEVRIISDGEVKVVIYKLVGDLDAANNSFALLYKDNVNAVFTFQRGPDKKKSEDGDKPDAEDDDVLTTYLAAIANANFVGNNKFLSNLTPAVNLGSIVDLCNKSYGKLADPNDPKSKKGLFSWRLDINPYIGGQIDTKDSVSFIPALMLGGRAGLSLNNYLSWGSENVTFTWMPLGFGLKIIPDLKDSATNVWQHNFRTGISLKYKDLFIIGGQYTYGFHNTTSQSKEFYSKVFSANSTDIQYLTLSGQFFIKSAKEETRNNYLFVEWRGLLSKNAYKGFTNTAIITVGFRKDLALTNTFATAASTVKSAATGRKTVTHKRRPSMF